MTRERVQELRYEIGDAMGDYAPDYFRRSRSPATELLIGLGSVLAALGIGYLAMRMSDRRMGNLIDSIQRPQGGSNDRPTVHGTSGAEMPETERGGRLETRRRTERSAVHETDGAEWPRPEAESRL